MGPYGDACVPCDKTKFNQKSIRNPGGVASPRLSGACWKQEATAWVLQIRLIDSFGFWWGGDIQATKQKDKLKTSQVPLSDFAREKFWVKQMTIFYAPSLVNRRRKFVINTCSPDHNYHFHNRCKINPSYVWFQNIVPGTLAVPKPFKTLNECEKTNYWWTPRSSNCFSMFPKSS